MGIDGVDGVYVVDGDDSDGGEDDDGEPEEQTKKEHYSPFLGPLSYCGVGDLCKNIQPFVELKGG